MQTPVSDLKSSLEKVDNLKDRFLFVFIKPYWPRVITPNHVTYVRVVIGIALFILLFFFNVGNKALIVGLFCIGALSDFIDGPVARGTNRVTEYGAMLDSTADRILIIPIAVYSLFLAHRWLLLTLLLIEILNAITSIYYKSKEIYLESNIFGKTKMVLQSFVFAAVLLFWPKTLNTLTIFCLWATIPFSLLSILSRVLELKGKTL